MNFSHVNSELKKKNKRRLNKKKKIPHKIDNLDVSQKNRKIMTIIIVSITHVIKRCTIKIKS